MNEPPELSEPIGEDAPRWRKGRLLVASPALHDPNFHRTVVLMLEHSAEGALGLVLNRPMQLRVHEAVPPPLCDLVTDDAVIHSGGPVQPEAVIILTDHATEPHTWVTDGVSIVDPQTSPDDLAEMTGQARAFGGYAGWNDGQLEAEIAEGAWFDAPCTSDDVFTDDYQDLWRRVVERKGGVYRLIATMPVDPTLN